MYRLSLVTGLAGVDMSIKTLAATFEDKGLRDELLDIFQAVNRNRISEAVEVLEVEVVISCLLLGKTRKQLKKI